MIHYKFDRSDSIRHTGCMTSSWQFRIFSELSMARIFLLFTIFLTLITPAWGSGLISDHAFTSFDPDDIAWVKTRIEAKDDYQYAAFTELIKKADMAILRTTTSVLDKPSVAPSGIKNDFYSIGAYSWPNPDKDKTAAYIRRDGMKNPEAYGDEYDKGRFNAMVSDVNTLALSYYFTSNEAYARKAGSLLKSWFIDPRTRMNPNLRHAAVQPGVNDGYYGGIIEAVVLIEMLDYVELLRGSNSFSNTDYKALATWFSDFSDWLINSDFGKDEIKSRNNHGSWYCAQVIAFSLYSGNKSRAISMIDIVKKNLHAQFDPDGSMPREMKRSNSFMYAIYGLRAFVVISKLTDHLGVSFWDYGDEDIPKIENAFYFLAPYFSGSKQWKGQMIDTDYDPYAIQIYRLAGNHYQTQPFNNVVGYLAEQKSDKDRFSRLLGKNWTPIHNATHDFTKTSDHSLSQSKNKGQGWIEGWKIQGDRGTIFLNHIGLTPRITTGNTNSDQKKSALQLNPIGEIVLSRQFSLPHPYKGEDYFISLGFQIVQDELNPSKHINPFLSIGLTGKNESIVSPLATFGKKGKFGIRIAEVDHLSKYNLVAKQQYCALVKHSDWRESSFTRSNVSIYGQNEDSVDIKLNSASKEAKQNSPLGITIRSKPGSYGYFEIGSVSATTDEHEAISKCRTFLSKQTAVTPVSP